MVEILTSPATEEQKKPTESYTSGTWKNQEFKEGKAYYAH